jgi:hypothetical protein
MTARDATQYLDEADQLAHRVAVLDGGRIVAEGTPAELKARIPGGHIELAFAGRAELDAAAMALAPAGRDSDALTLQLACDGRVSTLRTLLRQLDDASSCSSTSSAGRSGRGSAAGRRPACAVVCPAGAAPRTPTTSPRRSSCWPWPPRRRARRSPSRRTKSVETASNSPMFLILLPFLGSGFVPTSSLPTGMRWFAEYEPFTPVNETLRGLLTGTKIGDNLVITIAWCVGVAVLSYAWSRRLYEREPKALA